MIEKHILVVLPHPDDETFGAAGTLALYAQKGVSITYACATLGEMGRNMGNPIFANRETLPSLRKKELLKACNIIGIQDVRLLGFRDKTLEFEEENLLVDKIREIIDEINPSLVITHYPGHGVHPDHDACGLATIKAISKIPIENRPKTFCIAISKNRFEQLGEPDVKVDIQAVSEMKVLAMKAHESQTAGIIKDIEKQFNHDSDFNNWLKTEYFWTYLFN